MKAKKTERQRKAKLTSDTLTDLVGKCVEFPNAIARPIERSFANGLPSLEPMGDWRLERMIIKQVQIDFGKDARLVKCGAFSVWDLNQIDDKLIDIASWLNNEPFYFVDRASAPVIIDPDEWRQSKAKA